MSHRCTIAHFQGDVLVPTGATAEDLGVDVIPAFFEEVADERPARAKKATAKKAAPKKPMTSA